MKNTKLLARLTILILLILGGVFLVFNGNMQRDKRDLQMQLNTVSLRFQTENAVIQSKNKYVDVISQVNNEVFNIRKMFFNDVQHTEILYILSQLIKDSGYVITGISLTDPVSEQSELEYEIDGQRYKDQYNYNYVTATINGASDEAELYKFVDRINSYEKKLVLGGVSVSYVGDGTCKSIINLSFVNLTDLSAGYKLPNVNLDFEQSVIDLNEMSIDDLIHSNENSGKDRPIETPAGTEGE